MTITALQGKSCRVKRLEGSLPSAPRHPVLCLGRAESTGDCCHLSKRMSCGWPMPCWASHGPVSLTSCEEGPGARGKPSASSATWGPSGKVDSKGTPGEHSAELSHPGQHNLLSKEALGAGTAPHCITVVCQPWAGHKGQSNKQDLDLAAS